MKSLIVFRIHSIVDLITNSSSEVFVGSTDKTVKVIKSTLEKIVEAADGNSNSLWTSMLLEPEISLWTITVPHKDWSYNYEPEVKELSDYRKKYPEWPSEKATKKQKDDHQKRMDAYRVGLEEIESVVYKEDRQKDEDEQISFFKKTCKENNIDYIDLGKPEVHRSGKRATVSYPNAKGKKLKNLIERVEFCRGWGISIKKGDVLIFTQSDNTFDYKYFDIVNDLIGGSNYHLG